MSDNKTIAKNTIFLYVRSFLMMAINLYASRVILEALGVSDYGLYGAIGSIVMMFAIINGVLSVGTSRFLTFELGRNDLENSKDIQCFLYASCRNGIRAFSPIGNRWIMVS